VRVHKEQGKTFMLTVLRANSSGLTVKFNSLQLRPMVKTGYENLLLVRFLIEIQIPSVRKSSVSIVEHGRWQRWWPWCGSGILVGCGSLCWIPWLCCWCVFCTSPLLISFLFDKNHASLHERAPSMSNHGAFESGC